MSNDRFYIKEVEGHKFNYGLLKIYKDESGRMILEGESRTNSTTDPPIFSFKYDI